jgi:hypothetical protein
MRRDEKRGNVYFFKILFNFPLVVKIKREKQKKKLPE